MAKYEITIEDVDILEEGTYPAGHQIGEAFKYPEDRVSSVLPRSTRFTPIYGS